MAGLRALRSLAFPPVCVTLGGRRPLVCVSQIRLEGDYRCTGASATLGGLKGPNSMRLSFFSCLRFVAFTLVTCLTLIVLAPGCGRASLESELLDGAVPNACGPSTCPNGCCDRNGTCRTGGDTQACGSRGQKCSDCIANGFTSCDVPRGKVCTRSSDNCGPTDCFGGCCSFDGGRGTCVAGMDATACGGGGSACVDCSLAGRSCDSSTQTCSTSKCDATNCSGCCVGDLCLPGDDAQACGTSGNACVSCAQSGQQCDAQPSGGGRCEGTPSCTAENCSGCCDGTTCVAGSDSIACGKAGEACKNCTTTGRRCAAVGQPNERTCEVPPTCGPGNCPGCCVGNACVVATTTVACGKGGQACQPCADNETCDAGACVAAPACGPGNCAGCCLGDICAVGNQATACGTAGAQCSNCSAVGQVCQGSACQAPVCGPGNCAGCCSGNTCVLGTQDSACGQNGAACSDCAAGDLVCQGRVCRTKCGPANCAGCCAANNACALGFTNSACGSGGAACTNCSNSASTCNTLEVPRVCANAGGMCPAAYDGCAPDVATPVEGSLQGVCDDTSDLDALRAACNGGADTGTCEAALQVLAATNPACSACLSPFAVPFGRLTGLYRCAAPFVSGTCNHSTGCAVECRETSCVGCVPGSEDECVTSVSGAGGQCNTLVQQTACIVPAIGVGDLCGPGTYANNFGRWLRAVGDHFCGNGP